jgi:hypothetical protein
VKKLLYRRREQEADPIRGRLIQVLAEPVQETRRTPGQGSTRGGHRYQGREYFGGERQTKKRGDRGETDQRETRLWYSYKNLEDKLLT